MSVWVVNPYLRFGKYYHKPLSSYKQCSCTLERVQDADYRAEIVQIVIRNGLRQYRILWCQKMFRYYGGRDVGYVHNDGTSISHELLTAEEKENARIIVGGSYLHRTDKSTPVCEVCGAEHTEVHHWAPHALFEDAYNWPTSSLCPKHHRLWHRTVNRGKIINRSESVLQTGDHYCEHCERSSHEMPVFLHHWAPKQLFVDWDKWPTSHLCFDCIVNWRSVMKNKQSWVDPLVERIAREQCFDTDEVGCFSSKTYELFDIYWMCVEDEIANQNC